MDKVTYYIVEGILRPIAVKYIDKFDDCDGDVDKLIEMFKNIHVEGVTAPPVEMSSIPPLPPLPLLWNPNQNIVDVIPKNKTKNKNDNTKLEQWMDENKYNEYVNNGEVVCDYVGVRSETKGKYCCVRVNLDKGYGTKCAQHKAKINKKPYAQTSGIVPGIRDIGSHVPF